MSQNDFKTSETMQPPEASPVKPHMSVRGIDSAKRLFHVAGMTERGQIVLRKRLVVYLQPADNSPRLTRRLSQGLKVLDEWALMTSQQPSAPW